MTTYWKETHKRHLANGEQITVKGCYVTLTTSDTVQVVIGGHLARKRTTNCPSCGCKIRFVKFPKGGSAYFDDIESMWVHHHCMYLGKGFKGASQNDNMDLFQDYCPPNYNNAKQPE